jgi:hypothetical protein
LDLEAWGYKEVASHLNGAWPTLPCRNWGIAARHHFADPFEGHASFSELLDAQQLVEVAAGVVGGASLANGALDQAQLHVVTHRPFCQVGERAQLVKGEGFFAHGRQVVCLEAIVTALL